MATTDPQYPLLNWIPYKLIENNNGVFFEWVYLGEQRFTNPFFDDTIAMCKSHAYNSSGYKIITTANNVLQWAPQQESVPVAGLIFHVSRCGSTMVSQLLSIPRASVVISEAPVMDQIVRSKCLNGAEKMELIGAICSFFGQKRFDEETQLIVKMDAWHIFEIEYIRQVFPDVPFAVLYRKPADVIQSHQRLRGMHMIPHVLPPAVYGLEEEYIKNLSLDQFGICVLEKYFQAIYRFACMDVNTHLFDYCKGMENVNRELNIFFRLFYTGDIYRQMEERLKAHSKYPEGIFQPDKEAEPALIDLTKVNKMYGELAALQDKNIY